MKTFRVEIATAWGSKIVTTLQAETVEDAILAVVQDMNGKGQSCSFVSAWEVSND